MPITLRKGVSGVSLSLTPMIDVVFLLLIFFLVATRFEQEERDMDVDLAKASDAQPTIFQGREIFVTVTAQGDYFVDGQKRSPAELENLFQAMYRSNPGRQRVMIRADKESRTQQVVEVMNACNKAHILDYSLATE